MWDVLGNIITKFICGMWEEIDYEKSGEQIFFLVQYFGRPQPAIDWEVMKRPLKAI